MCIFSKNIVKVTLFNKSIPLFLRKLRHFLISKTCFDVTNIIVSYKIFVKTVRTYITN